MYFTSLENCTKDRSSREQAPERYIYIYIYENYNNNIKRLFILFPNLITKESYNWWITRRFWGFRQQICKAKYLIISQNISKCQWHKSGSFKRTPRHCAKWLLSHPGRRYQMIRIRPSGEVEMPPLPSGVRCRMQNIRWNVPDVRHPNGMSAQ